MRFTHAGLEPASIFMSNLDSKPKIGIIAGFGDFPLEVCTRARSAGYEVSLCAVKQEASPELESFAERSTWVGLGEIGKLLKFFKGENVREAILCGKIHKKRILGGNVIPDLDTIKMLAGVKNFKDDSLLGAFTQYLEKNGITILESTAFLKEALLFEGLLTKNRLTRAQWEDVEFGFEVAKKIAGMDIGQTVVVKNKSVVAVESVEGTDETIERGGRLAEKEAVAVKVAKPNQDMRFDVPTIGPSTLDACQKGHVSVLAFEAGKTIVLHSENVIRTAQERGIALLAYTPEKIKR